MSGHSKWSKVKHQKETTDAVKSQAFTRASRSLTIAVKEGGGVTDPDKNFRLRLAIDQARSVNMPKETIERAIARGLGGGGESVESVIYEGYGPGGVGYLVYAITDNHQRTGAMLKHTFEHSGGSLAAPHAVEYLFERGTDERMRPRYPMTVSEDVRSRNKTLMEALTSLPDINNVITTLGQ